MNSILTFLFSVIVSANCFSQDAFPKATQDTALKHMCEDSTLCYPDGTPKGSLIRKEKSAAEKSGVNSSKSSEVPDEFVVPDGKGSYVYYYKLSKDFGYGSLVLCSENVSAPYFDELIRNHQYRKVPAGVVIYKEK